MSRGRTFTVKIYSENSAQVIKKSLAEIEETLEYMSNEIGDYMFDSLLIYFDEKTLANCEYPGATITNSAELSHEIIHNWFGRSIFPANGEAGWIDEAITSWFERKKTGSVKMVYPSCSLAGFDEYVRVTNDEAYTTGRHFIHQLFLLGESKVKNKPNLFLEFLKNFHKEFLFKTITHSIFIDRLKDAMGPHLESKIDSLLDRYIYLNKRALPKPGLGSFGV